LWGFARLDWLHHRGDIVLMRHTPGGATISLLNKG
jgi:hypothetical protein